MSDFEKVETENVSVHRGDDKIPRDNLGRYRLPDPETGKVKSWTRVTTVAETLKDRRGLERWDQRNIIYGIGQRPALYAKAAASKLTDRDTLDGIAKRAREAADAEAGADMGTALHTFTERVDRGERFEINEPFASDIRAYRMALDAEGIATALGWIERPLFVPVGDGHAVVGTCDRLNNAMEWTLPRVGDVKTATDKPDPKGGPDVNTILRYGMVDIPLQLAMYAHATHWWDVETEQWAEMPAVDQEKAMVFHVPAGLGECRIYAIDIAAGWEAVEHAMWDRGWRRRKDLYETVIWIDAKRADMLAQRGANGEGDGERQTGVLPGKGGEAGPFPAEDPPAQPDPPSPIRHCHECNPGDDPAPWCDCQADERCPPEKACRHRSHSPDDCPTLVPDPDAAHDPDPFAERHAWCAERVKAIKLHDKARKRLAGLWSLRAEIPTFPKGGPRNADELSAVIGMCDLVEMEFQMPFGPPDPAAEHVGPTPSEKRRAEIEQAEAAKAAAMSKTRNRKRATKTKGPKDG